MGGWDCDPGMKRFVGAYVRVSNRTNSGSAQREGRNRGQNNAAKSILGLSCTAWEKEDKLVDLEGGDYCIDLFKIA